MSEREIAALKIVRHPAQKRRPVNIWDHPRYQAWLKKSYEDARRTVERLGKAYVP